MRNTLSSQILPLAALLLLWSLPASASTPPQSALIDGHLPACPNSPNCVNSEAAGPTHIAPLAYTSDKDVAWRNLKKCVEDTEGTIVDTQPGYLRAIYTSQVLRFVDDVEFRLDEAASIIQVRSASRVGYWDLGVNRRRVEWLRRLFTGRDERSGR